MWILKALYHDIRAILRLRDSVPPTHGNYRARAIQNAVSFMHVINKDCP